jgi:NADPH:quinone reductase
MSNSTEIRRVTATPGGGHVIAVTSGAHRPAFSNEAVVRVTAFSMNRGELGRARNAETPDIQIGWDFAGVVETVAADGSGPSTGTRVVGFSPRMEGWAELVSIPTSYIAPIPDGVTDAEAATLPVAGLTALHSVDAATGLIGRKALITGATGGVGMFATQLALIGGAETVAQVRRADQVPFVEALGNCTPVVSADGSGLGDPGTYRLVVDGVSGPILEGGIKALAPDGICVCYGITSAPEIAIEVRPFMFSGEAKIMGFFLYSQAETDPPSDNLPRLLRLVAEGRLDCGIQREASWDEAGQVAQDLLDRKFSGKAVLHVR